MKFGLAIETIQQLEKVILSSNSVEKIIIYGSRAKGDFQAGSDIDLVLLGDSIRFEDLSKMEAAIDDLLLPYKIDLSSMQEITNQDLREHINRVGKEFSV